MAKITFSTNSYRANHGAKPRGRGNWMFELHIGGASPRIQTFGAGSDRTFTEARKLALAEARVQGAHHVEVMS